MGRGGRVALSARIRSQEVKRRKAWKDFSRSVAEHGSIYPRLISCSYVRTKDAVENESYWRNFAF